MPSPRKSLAPSAVEDDHAAAMHDHASLIRLSMDSLDWPRVVDALVQRAATAVGREPCADPPLLDDVEDVRLLLRQVSQMRALAEEERVPLGGVRDVRAQVTRCTKGELLEGRLLLEVADTLEGLARLRKFLLGRPDRCPELQHLAGGIVALPELQSRLSASFDRSGELSTVTYPHLIELRTRKARLHETIRGQLEDLTSSVEWAGALQEDYLTQRNDRYVVPVKVKAKSMDLGIVHDTSGSGQTLYVEPREVVGLNNRLKMADAELKREEMAIIGSLCESVAAWAHEIRAGLDLTAQLDAIHARARLATDLDAAEPTVADGPSIHLRAARHPLLALKGTDVVPNDLRLDADRCALILSGPNAGGKTITLKTLGVCALMVRAGMHLPVEAGSHIGLFAQILTDIGDQQSVQEDLSTFSGHLLALNQVLRMLQESDGDALVLVDEIAVGTDPQQGAALAAAVLRALLDRGALTVATTHYAPLKALAEVDDRFVNGRLEFDPDALRPTYRLGTGNPGRSYAFDIARHLGLPEDVLADAEARVEPTHREVEALLASLEEERAEVRKTAEQAEQERTAAQRERRDIERQAEELKQRLRSLREEVIETFDGEVEGYREVVRGIIRELQKAPSLTAADRARRRIATGGDRVRQGLEKAVGRPRTESSAGVDWDAVRIGDPILVVAGDREGALASLPDRKGRVEVLIGGARIVCKVKDLAPPKAPPVGVPNRGPVGGMGRSSRRGGLPPGWKPDKGPELDVDIEGAVRTPDNTLDLRGERVDEALDKVDQFLDDASMAGRAVVFILHGHGTGALRNAVRTHLRQSPYVREQRTATRSQGGDALTAVRL